MPWCPGLVSEGLRPLWSGPSSDWPGTPAGACAYGVPGRLTWTLPSAGNRIPREWKPGRFAPSAVDSRRGRSAVPGHIANNSAQVVPRVGAVTWLTSSLRCPARGSGYAARAYGGAIAWEIHPVESREVDEYGCHCSSRLIEPPRTPQRFRSYEAPACLSGFTRQSMRPAARVLGISSCDYERSAWWRSNWAQYESARRVSPPQRTLGPESISRLNHRRG